MKTANEYAEAIRKLGKSTKEILAAYNKADQDPKVINARASFYKAQETAGIAFSGPMSGYQAAISAQEAANQAWDLAIGKAAYTILTGKKR